MLSHFSHPFRFTRHQTTKAFPNLTRIQQIALLCMVLLPATIIPWLDYGLLVALPNIQKSLHASATQVIWVYFIAFIFSSVFIAPSGRYGDCYGRVRVYGIFLIFYLAGAILLAIGNHIWLVYVGRALLGVGCGGMQPLGAAIIHSAFVKRFAERMIIVWGLLCYSGFLLGCFLAGLFSEHAVGWRLLAWISLVLIAIGFVLMLYCLRLEKVKKDKVPIDWTGILLVGGFQLWILILFSFGPIFGWTSPIEIVSYVVTPGLLLAFICVARYKGSILIDFKITCGRHFLIGSSLIFLMNGSIVALIYLWVNYAYSLFGLHYSFVRIGVCALIIGAPMVLIGLFTAKLMQVAKPTLLVLFCSVCALAGCIVLMYVTPATPFVNIWWRLVLIGIGFSLPWLLALPIALHGVDPAFSGAATSAFEVLRYTGNIIISLVAAAIYQAYHHDILHRVLHHAADRHVVLQAMRMGNRTHAFSQLARHENLSFVMHMSAHAFFYAMIPILVACALGVALCLLYVFSFPDEIPGHGSCH